MGPTGRFSNHFLSDLRLIDDLAKKLLSFRLRGAPTYPNKFHMIYELESYFRKLI